MTGCSGVGTDSPTLPTRSPTGFGAGLGGVVSAGGVMSTSGTVTPPFGWPAAGGSAGVSIPPWDSISVCGSGSAAAGRAAARRAGSSVAITPASASPPGGSPVDGASGPEAICVSDEIPPSPPPPTATTAAASTIASGAISDAPAARATALNQLCARSTLRW